MIAAIKRIRARRYVLASGTCPNCGSGFQRRVTRNSERRQFCTKSCSVAFRWKTGAMDATVKARRDAARCADRARSLMIAERLLRLNARHYERMFGRCRRCDAIYWRETKNQQFCDETCKTLSAADSRRRARSSSTYRAAKKAHKARRRARESVLVECFDPIEVLVRDGWTCMECGIETPPRLRGSYEPNAPEVDHVIPLARGGAHTRLNTRCTCRACNLRKGASMSLHGGGGDIRISGGIVWNPRPQANFCTSVT